MNKLHTTNKPRLLLTVGLFAALCIPVSAQILSVNFSPNTAQGELAATDVAGLVPAANWNNASRGSGNFGSYSLNPVGGLVDSTGAATGASLQYNSSGNSNTAGFLDASDVNPDINMLSYGFLAYAQNGSLTVTINNLPEAFTTPGYEVYVYWGGLPSAAGAGDDIRGITTLGSETYVFRYINNVDERSSYADYSVVTATTSASAVTGPNTVVFGATNPLTANSFAFTIAHDQAFPRRVGISGLQIVAIPEPSTTVAIFGAAAFAGVLFLRRRRK